MHVKRKIVLAALAVVTIGAGTAYGYWTTTGSGTGSGTVGSSNGTLVLHASFADGLAPGNSTFARCKADNPGTTNLRINTITTVVTASGTCDASWFTVPPVAANQTIAAGATTAPATALDFVHQIRTAGAG
ncbi:hypothetical protein [Kribbella sp. NPDC055071]